MADLMSFINGPLFNDHHNSTSSLVQGKRAFKCVMLKFVIVGQRLNLMQIQTLTTSSSQHGHCTYAMLN